MGGAMESGETEIVEGVVSQGHLDRRVSGHAPEPGRRTGSDRCIELGDASCVAVPRAHQRSSHRRDDPHRGRPGPPSRRSPARTARTPVTAPPACGRRAPARPSAGKLERISYSCSRHRGLLSPKWSAVHESGSIPVGPTYPQFRAGVFWPEIGWWLLTGKPKRLSLAVQVPQRHLVLHVW